MSAVANTIAFDMISIINNHRAVGTPHCDASGIGTDSDD
jgi:hypothetical protein